MDNGNDTTKMCGFCGMDVPAEAGRCPYCGSLLEVNAAQNIFTDSQDKKAKSSEENMPAADDREEFAGYKADDEPQPDVKPVFEAKPAFSAGNSYQRNYNVPSAGSSGRPLSNGLKVFLTILFTVIPGIGQLAGIITAIVFMNAEEDADRKSFGVALLIASIIMFVLSCIGCFVLTLVFSINQSSIFYGN